MDTAFIVSCDFHVSHLFLFRTNISQSLSQHFHVLFVPQLHVIYHVSPHETVLLGNNSSLLEFLDFLFFLSSTSLRTSYIHFSQNVRWYQISISMSWTVYVAHPWNNTEFNLSMKPEFARKPNQNQHTLANKGHIYRQKTLEIKRRKNLQWKTKKTTLG